MLDVLRFWLDRGVDGFRIDVAHMLMKDPELRDNPPNPDGAATSTTSSTRTSTTQLHVHDRMHPDLHEVLRDDPRGARRVRRRPRRDRRDRGDGVGALGRATSASELRRAAPAVRVPADRDAVGGRASWPSVDRRAGGGAAGRRVADPRARQPRPAAPRHPARPAQARVAAMLLLTLRGTPTLFYGDELGMRGPGRPARAPARLRSGSRAGGVSPRPDAHADALERLARTPASRRRRRAELWLPDRTGARATLNVAAQLARPALDARRCTAGCSRCARASPALARRRVRAAPQQPTDDCLAYVREAGGERRLVALNLTGASRAASRWASAGRSCSRPRWIARVRRSAPSSRSPRRGRRGRRSRAIRRGRVTPREAGRDTPPAGRVRADARPHAATSGAPRSRWCRPAVTLIVLRSRFLPVALHDLPQPPRRLDHQTGGFVGLRELHRRLFSDPTFRDGAGEHGDLHGRSASRSSCVLGLGGRARDRPRRSAAAGWSAPPCSLPVGVPGRDLGADVAADAPGPGRDHQLHRQQRSGSATARSCPTTRR